MIQIKKMVVTTQENDVHPNTIMMMNQDIDKLSLRRCYYHVVVDRLIDLFIRDSRILMSIDAC
jgi:hypothetical protein